MREPACTDDDATVAAQLDYLATAITRAEERMIDPRDFGRVEAEVKSLQRQVGELAHKVDELLELANRSKGGFWAGMTIASILGGIATWLFERLVAR